MLLVKPLDPLGHSPDPCTMSKIPSKIRETNRCSGSSPRFAGKIRGGLTGRLATRPGPDPRPQGPNFDFEPIFHFWSVFVPDSWIYGPESGILGFLDGVFRVIGVRFGLLLNVKKFF